MICRRENKIIFTNELEPCEFVHTFDTHKGSIRIHYSIQKPQGSYEDWWNVEMDTREVNRIH